MELNDTLNIIFSSVVLPLLISLTIFVIQWLNAKKVEIMNKVENDTADKYIALLFETISDCVSATTQTYVESLKKQGKFDGEAQKDAFQMTFDAVMNTLTEEAKMYLTEIYGDLNAYLTTKIEAEVKAQK